MKVILVRNIDVSGAVDQEFAEPVHLRLACRNVVAVVAAASPSASGNGCNDAVGVDLPNVGDPRGV